MIHTANIIETSIRAWRQLIGHSIDDIAAFSLPGLDELAEIALTIRPRGTRLHVSWMQEDGKNDDTLFYWLSIRNESHFNRGSLVPLKIDSPTFSSLANSDITSVRLFGRPATDAVFACLVQTNRVAFGIATTHWLPGKQRFLQAGSEELAVLDASVLQSLVSAQSLAVVADLN